MTIAQKATVGIIWNFAEQLGKHGVSVLITLLLARLLTPADFGLVAMMSVFLAIATSLMDSGIKSALIRRTGAGQMDFNTAFYTNLALGSLSYILIFLSAPFIAIFYSEPQLISLIRVAGVNILFNAFQVVQIAILSRQLNFKLQLQANIPAGFISGLLAVGLAYLGSGVWALIVQMLMASLIATILLWRLQGWRPTAHFSRQALSEMYGFGYKLFLSGLLDTIFRNLYVIVIAKLFSATIAGQYFFASKLKDLLVGQLVGSIETVTYPALSTLQKDDKRLKDAYRKIIGVTTFIVFPSMLFLAALANPLFNALLPEKWLTAATYLQLMCIGSVMYPLHAINLNILQVQGRSDLFLYLEVIKKAMTVTILVISCRYGITGILIGQIIGSVLCYVPNSYFSTRLINYSVREQMADCMSGLALSGSIALAVYVTGVLVHWSAFAKLIVLGFTAPLLYLAGAHLLRFQVYLMARQTLAERLARGV